MKEIKIRLLKANEIECRVQQVNKKGCIALIYKDARVDMKILDEVFGIDGWQRTHEVINGNLFCTIEIWNSDLKTWVKKQDVGIESKTEKEKGEASDSFKRAGFNVGIGRELYTAPFIWINLDENETTERDGRVYLAPSIKFSVKSISYDENRDINSLVIVDQKGKIRYTMGNVSSPTTESKKSEPKIKEQEIKPLTEKEQVLNFLSNNSGASEYYGKQYGVKTIDAYTEEQYVEIYNSLKINKKI